MASRFLLQIVDRESGHTVHLEPGLLAEREFVDDCVSRIIERLPSIASTTAGIAARGVGVGRTTAHVAADISGGLQDTAPLVHTAIRTGIAAAILDLKSKVRTDGRR